MSSEIPISDAFHQLWPVEQEQYLAGLLLARTRTYLAQEALKEVEPEDFADPMLATLWAGARWLTGEGQMITLRALRTYALHQLPPTRDGRRDTAMLDRALDRIAGSVPPADYAPEAITAVREMGQLRRMYEAAQRMQQRILESPDPTRALAAVSEEVEGLDKQVVSGGPVQVSDLVEDFEESMRGGPTSPAVPTPWEEFNEICSGGLYGGRLYVVGGRPGDGKTNVGLVLAGQAASEGTAAHVFSAEMSRHEIMQRVVAREGAIELSQIQRHNLEEWEWRRFQEFRARAADLPLWIDDRPGIGLPYIKTVARQQKRRNNIGLIVVDYLQLLRTENRRVSRQEQIGEMSRGLKELARELDVPIVALAQLNRNAVDRAPMMSDLRESGDIESDADTIMLIEHPKDEDGNPTGKIMIHIPKNRHGRPGKVELTWRAHRADVA
jgi:replicative DNA helicase